MTYAILTMHNDSYKSLADITMFNKQEYCNYRGHKLFAKIDNFSTVPGGIYFDKLRHILDILDNNPDITWVWWLDCDAMITNFNQSIEKWCDDDYHIVIAYDRYTINNGSFFIRNTKEGKGFIRHALSLEQNNIYYNETHAMEAIYKTNEYFNIIKFHSQRDFNSYDYEIYKTLNKKGEPHYEDTNDIDLTGNCGNWQYGDFVCHWPGINIKYKVPLASNMLLNVMKCADLGTEVYHNFAHWANKRQRELQDIVITRTKNVVQSGIFQGMKILPWTIWGISDHASKLLGIYECELYGTVKQILGTNPDLILNIGCAEGFWGIGCARLTGIKTLLIDISEDALEVAKRNMLVNDLDNIEFSTDSSIDKLQQELKDRINPFMIMDVESNELDLLDLDKIPALNHTTIIVEAHDCQIPGITETLISRFSLSHDLEVITQGAKNPYVYVIRDLNDLDKSLLCNEGRPVTMQWIYMVPKKIAIDF